MRRRVLVALGWMVTVLLVAAPASAWHHGRARIFVGVGPGYWWGPPYSFWYPPPYYPPTVIVEEPPVYIQQEAPPPLAPPASEVYWYYCSSAKAYYPDAPTCPEAWVKVPPRPQ